MNERIKQLALQAGAYVSLTDEHYGNLLLSGDDTIEYFAELIVGECVDICHKMAEESDSYAVHDGDTCAEQIKQHFGVEE